MTKINNKPTQRGEFLPNLCHPQSVLFLVVVVELIAVLQTLSGSHLPLFNWDLLALNSVQTQWIALTSAFIICRLRPWLRCWTPVRAGLTSYAVVLIVTLVLSTLGQILLQFFSTPMPLNSYQLTFSGWQLLSNLITSAILSGITLRYLYLQQQLHNREQAELQARIQALQSRIRPHFLFNSMNSIASLIGSDPEKAEHLVEDLAELFRASLAEPALIPLNREITLCRRYLEIEQLRLGKRLHVDWQINPTSDAIKIPSLMLQPLLENAIFHGIEPMPNGGTVTIKISQAKQQLMIAIINPYMVGKKSTGAFTPQKNAAEENISSSPLLEDRHNRMALDNIRHRLRVHYGNAARLSSSEEQGLFTTYIFCPLTV